MIDEVLQADLSRFRDRVRCLALGADEQDPAALGDDVADRQKCLMQQGNSLRQVNDVDIVSCPEDVALHLGVPAVCLVSEVNACLKQTTHSKFRQSHGPVLLFSG